MTAGGNKRRMHILQIDIEKFYSQPPSSPEQAKQALGVFQEFRAALTRGEIRAAENKSGQWMVNTWVKQGILLGFRLLIKALFRPASSKSMTG
jgi:tetrahydrodipicolinate N-succinyltransferase